MQSDAVPIRKEFRRYYGQAWRRYRQRLIERDGPCCAFCKRYVARYLSLAHLTHDPRSSSVALLCVACHNRHDAAFRLAVRRRNHARKYGQLWLWEEIKWAPFPSWLVPRQKQPEPTLF